MGLPCNAGDPGQIPGSGRSPGGGCGNTLQSCLENPTDRGAWQATVHGVAKSWTRLKRTSCGAPACLPSSVDSTELAQVGDGRPAEVPEGMRTWAGVGCWRGGRQPGTKCLPARGAAAAKTVILRCQPAARTPTVLTCWQLPACLLSCLLNLTSLEIIALILLTLIVHRDVFISCFSLS